MSGDAGKFERLKMLFPGYRRMRHLEQRLEMLQTELLAALGRESAAMSESVRLVRAEAIIPRKMGLPIGPEPRSHLTEKPPK